MKTFRNILFTVVLLISCVLGQKQRIVGADALANDVKKEFLHSWNAYKKYAWGSDGVQPLTKTPYNWHASPLLLTPVDALSTMHLMGLTKEAKKTEKLILSKLS
ncbi:MAG: glycoside hydrolase family 47 protein, partial [Bacteroidota bacterium]